MMKLQNLNQNIHSTDNSVDYKLLGLLSWATPRTFIVEPNYATMSCITSRNKVYLY